MQIEKIKKHASETIYFTDEDGNVLLNGDKCYIINKFRVYSLSSYSIACVTITNNSIEFTTSIGSEKFISYFDAYNKLGMFECTSRTRDHNVFLCINEYEARIPGYLKKI